MQVADNSRIQVILEAIDTFNNLDKNEDREEWERAIGNLSFTFIINKHLFNFNDEEIEAICDRANSAGIFLSDSNVKTIFDQCSSDLLLNEAVAEKLFDNSESLSYDLFNLILDKCDKNAKEKVKNIRKERYKTVLNAIANLKGKRDEKLTEACLELDTAMVNFRFFFSAKEVKEICKKFVDSKVRLGKCPIMFILCKCSYMSLDQAATKALLKISIAGALDDDVYNWLCVKRRVELSLKEINLFLSKCDEKNNCKNVKSQQLYLQLRYNERKKRNLGIAGVIVGGLGAIGLAVAVGVGALVITTSAAIIAPVVVGSVVAVALIAVGSWFIDRFRVEKVINEIKRCNLNNWSYNKEEIPWDLRNRKEIKNVLYDWRTPPSSR